MSALTAHDSWLQSPAAADETRDLSPILDDMVAEPDCFDNWLSNRLLPASIAGLLSLLLDRGLPRNDGSSRDDELCDMYSVRMQSVRADFDAWAQQPERFMSAPIDQWLAGSRP